MREPAYPFLDDERYPMGILVETVDDLTPQEREVYTLLDLIVAEWETDPTSVQCFDSRIIERAKKAVAPFRQLMRLRTKERHA